MAVADDENHPPNQTVLQHSSSLAAGESLRRQTVCRSTAWLGPKSLLPSDLEPGLMEKPAFFGVLIIKYNKRYN
jgi:hypothetical protein